jgi:hypothetical protein
MKKEELELERMKEITSSVEKFFSELLNNQKLSNEMLKKVIIFLYEFGDSLKNLREEAARKIFEQNPSCDDLMYVWMYTSLKLEARRIYEERISEKI